MNWIKGIKTHQETQENNWNLNKNNILYLQSKLSKSFLDLRFRSIRLDPKSLVRVHDRRRRIGSSSKKPDSISPHLIITILLSPILDLKPRSWRPRAPISSHHPNSCCTCHSLKPPPTNTVQESPFISKQGGETLWAEAERCFVKG